jgi:lipoyl-dependent peroxiredoxin subunit C
MLTVGDRLPEFDLQATVSLDRGKEFTQISNQSHPGQWLVLFSWPMDFTFVCPTEIAEFGKRNQDFRERDAQVLGMSTDTTSSTWRGGAITRI